MLGQTRPRSWLGLPLVIDSEASRPGGWGIRDGQRDFSGHFWPDASDFGLRHREKALRYWNGGPAAEPGKGQMGNMRSVNQMKKYRILTAVIVACALLALGVEYATAAGQPPQPEWTQADTARGYVVFSHSTLSRVGPGYVPAREAIVDKVSCALAGNEYESLQLGVHAIESDLKDLHLEVESDLQVRVYHGGGAVGESKAGETPLEMVLHNGGMISKVASGKSVNFWLTFHASRETPAGLHKGKIRIKADGRPATVLDLEVRVRPFVLNRPRIPIGIWYLQSRAQPEPLAKAVFRDMAEHGQTSVGLYDYMPLAEQKAASGEQGVLRYLALAKPTGLAHPDIPWLWLTGGDWDYVEDGKKFTATQESKTKDAVWLNDELRKKGLPKLILYGGDEPRYPWPELREMFLPWREIPIRVGTAMDSRGAYGHSDLHDVWIVHCNVLTPEMRDEAARMGAQVWMYSCMTIPSETLRQRYLAGIFTWSNKVLGSYLWQGPGLYELFWWQEAGKGPIPMVGWETRREGVDDYRYLQMLEDCVAAKPDDTLAVEAAGWLEALRLRYNMNPLKVEPGLPLALGEYDSIRSKAADYIERLGSVSEEDLNAAPVTTLRDEAKPFRRKSVRQCIKGLSHRDWRVRRSAAWALFEMGPAAAPATASLADLLDDPQVRIPALRALEAIGPDAYTAVPQVASLLAHPDAYVRIGATYALGAIGGAPTESDQLTTRAPDPPASLVVEPLRAVLNDDDPLVPKIAKRLLTKIGPVPQIEAGRPEPIPTFYEENFYPNEYKWMRDANLIRFDDMKLAKEPEEGPGCLLAKTHADRAVDASLIYQFKSEYPLTKVNVQLDAAAPSASKSRNEIALSIDGKNWPLATEQTDCEAIKPIVLSAGEDFLKGSETVYLRIRMQNDARAENVPANRLDYLRVECTNNAVALWWNDWGTPEQQGPWAPHMRQSDEWHYDIDGDGKGGAINLGAVEEISVWGTKRIDAPEGYLINNVVIDWGRVKAYEHCGGCWIIEASPTGAFKGEQVQALHDSGWGRLMLSLRGKPEFQNIPTMYVKLMGSNAFPENSSHGPPITVVGTLGDRLTNGRTACSSLPVDASAG